MTLVVTRALGLVTIQDLGRPGHMHEAMPPGGALVPARLVAANRTVQNPDDTPAIEVVGELAVRAERACIVATDAWPARPLAAGAELVIASEPRRVTYLAMRGGFAAPLVLGGRGALLCAGLGGLVRRAQQLDSAGAPAVRPPDDTRAGLDDGDVIRIVPGPDPAAFTGAALATLCAAPYRIEPTSNRVGTRLHGAAIPRSAAPEASRPMVLGAIEVPGDGQPIVLGPEHPVTGGYPVLAVVIRADLDRLCSLRLGASVRFTR